MSTLRVEERLTILWETPHTWWGWFATVAHKKIGYLLPQWIGARDMAYPRVNAFTCWAFVLPGIFLYASFFFSQAPNGGWSAYVPPTTERFSPGYGMDFYALALILFTISIGAGGFNFIVTIFKLRAPGMSINRMPLMGYSTLTMLFLSLFAMPALGQEETS